MQSRPDDLLLAIISCLSAIFFLFLKGLDYMNFANQNEIEKLETENKKYIEKLHNFNHPVGGIHSEPFTENDT
jgi:hypothetical protein